MKTEFTQSGIIKQRRKKVKGQVSIVVTRRLLSQVQESTVEVGINVWDTDIWVG